MPIWAGRALALTQRHHHKKVGRCCPSKLDKHCRRMRAAWYCSHGTAGGMMSADMARERRRRSWELKEEEALTAEEEEAQRRKERREVRLHALGVPCTCADCGCRAVLALMQPACLPACLPACADAG